MRNIEEIIKIKKRDRAYLRGEYEVVNLERDLQAQDSIPLSFTAFVPIHLVTIIEAVVRRAVAELIDNGEPYSSVAVKLLSNVSGKMLATAVLAVGQKKLTVGTLASFGFTVGRLDEALALLTLLFGTDAKKEFAEIGMRWIEEDKNKAGPVIQDIDATFASIRRLFEVRHIVVHECSSELPYQREELEGFLHHARLFVTALDWLVVKYKHDRIPYTQTQMNIEAGNRAALVQTKLDNLRGGTAERFADPKSKLEELEYYWDKFSDLSAQAYAGYIDQEWPGTIAPLLYASHRQQLNEWRIDLLSKGLRWNPEAEEDA